MKKTILLGLLFLTILSLNFVSADCPIKVNAKSTSQLIAEIPSINTQLSNCPTPIPNQLSKLIKNGNFLLEISDAEDIVATIKNGNITEVKVLEGAKYNFKMSVSSCQLDNILSKGNPTGAFATYYLNGNANLGASGLINKVKLFIGKLFVKSAFKNVQIAVDDCKNATKSIRPENCYDTYLPGYQEYSDPKVKEIWDTRLAETGNVCQTQTSERPKGDCTYLYEQIKNNDKKWVCWYK